MWRHEEIRAAEERFDLRLQARPPHNTPSSPTHSALVAHTPPTAGIPTQHALVAHPPRPRRLHTRPVDPPPT
eukprot:7104553-Prymnesium_polylepis.1